MSKDIDPGQDLVSIVGPLFSFEGADLKTVKSEKLKV